VEIQAEGWIGYQRDWRRLDRRRGRNNLQRPNALVLTIGDSQPEWHRHRNRIVAQSKLSQHILAGASTDSKETGLGTIWAFKGTQV